MVQNNEWGASDGQCVTTNGGPGFSVDSGNHNKNDAPAAYPSIMSGCWMGTCTKGTTLPTQIGQLGPLSSSIAGQIPAGTKSNLAYDIWADSTPKKNGHNDKLELMIWLKETGGIKPIGDKAGQVAIGGANWDVWKGTNGGVNVISYLRQGYVDSADNLPLTDFVKDAVKQGVVSDADFLTNVQAGFEPWTGGPGLQLTRFDVTNGQSATGTGTGAAANSSASGAGGAGSTSAAPTSSAASSGAAGNSGNAGSTGTSSAAPSSGAAQSASPQSSGAAAGTGVAATSAPPTTSSGSPATSAGAATTSAAPSTSARSSSVPSSSAPQTTSLGSKPSSTGSGATGSSSTAISTSSPSTSTGSSAPMSSSSESAESSSAAPRGAVKEHVTRGEVARGEASHLRAADAEVQRAGGGGYSDTYSRSLPRTCGR